MDRLKMKERQYLTAVKHSLQDVYKRQGYYNMLIHGKKPVSDKLADQLQNVLQEYRKEKESGYRMQTHFVSSFLHVSLIR